MRSESNPYVGILPLALVILFFIVFTNGCRSLANMVTHDWVKSVSLNVEQGRLVSVLVDQAALWEPGDEAGPLADQLGRSLEFYIDGTPIPPNQIDTFRYGVEFIHVYDLGGNEIGSHTGEFYVSVYAPSEVGQHTATVQMTSTSGHLYSYSWQFEVVERATSEPEK